MSEAYIITFWGSQKPIWWKRPILGAQKVKVNIWGPFCLLEVNSDPFTWFILWGLCLKVFWSSSKSNKKDLGYQKPIWFETGHLLFIKGAKVGFKKPISAIRPFEIDFAFETLKILSAEN